MIIVKELNIASNFIVFLATLWACLSPRVPCRFFGQAFLCTLSIVSLVNIEVTNQLQISISGLIWKVMIAGICLWAFWHFEKTHLSIYLQLIIDDVKAFFKRTK